MSSNGLYINTQYLKDVYHIGFFNKKIKRCERVLKEFGKKNKFDTILFTGNSGAAFAYPLSISLKKHLLCLRKGKSHFGPGFEGNFSINKYIIVDDFIESGITIDRLLNKTSKKFKESSCVGILLYCDKNRGKGSYYNYYYKKVDINIPIIVP
jgi:orotate phosphoribosyltransferase-like protein